MNFGMNERENQNTMEKFERQMQKRISRSKQHQRHLRNQRLALIAFLLVMIIAAVVLLVWGLSASTSPIKGAWTYKSDVILHFDGSDSGALYLDDLMYPFTYRVEDDLVSLCFENAYITDAVYSFTVEEDRLTLIGGDGTTGGVYTLSKSE